MSQCRWKAHTEDFEQPLWVDELPPLQRGFTNIPSSVMKKEGELKCDNVDFYDLILRCSRGQRVFDGAARHRGGGDGDGEAMAAGVV